MFFQCKKIIVCTAFIAVSEASVAQNFAARVVGKKRYASDAPAVDPSAPANNAFIEEDLTGPSPGKKREVKSIPPAPPPPSDVPASRTPASSGLPSEAWDPRKPDSSRDMRPQDEPREVTGYDDDSDIGVSAGIGFGSRAFSASLGLTFPIYRWLAWSLSGSYYTAAKDEEKETRYGPEGSLMLRFPSRIPITPFAGLGVGYDKWARVKNEKLFDDSASLLSLYFVGISIPMAKHLALSISQTWKTYLGRPPRTFEDPNKYEPYGSTRFNVGLAVSF